MGEAVTEEESNPLVRSGRQDHHLRKEAAVHKAKVLGLLIGTVDLALRMIKRVSFGTIIAGLLLPGALL